MIPYCTVKPTTGVTAGNTNAALQVFVGAALKALMGRINHTYIRTSHRILLSAWVQAAVSPCYSIYISGCYRQPGVVGIAGAAVHAPPLILYCTVKPTTGVTAGSTNAALQVFGASTGSDG
ncbi:MAG: hypothetical protein IPG00_13100 [Saprospiraceae bacterium]|nr:hypothetical protein [Saprospiraceae bacterium]